MRAEFTDDENVPRIPPMRVGGGLYYRDAGVFIRAGVLYAFPQNRTAPEEIATPGYTLYSAEASYTWDLDPAEFAPGPGGRPRFTLGLRGENLANGEVLNHASFKRREDVFLPGTSVRLFGRVTFD